MPTSNAPGCAGCYRRPVSGSSLSLRHASLPAMGCRSAAIGGPSRSLERLRTATHPTDGDCFVPTGPRCRFAAGGRRQKGANATTLSDLGISKSQSSTWQQLADVPEELFEIALAHADKPTARGIIGAAPKTHCDIVEEVVCRWHVPKALARTRLKRPMHPLHEEPRPEHLRRRLIDHSRSARDPPKRPAQRSTRRRAPLPAAAARPSGSRVFDRRYNPRASLTAEFLG